MHERASCSISAARLSLALLALVAPILTNTSRVSADGDRLSGVGQQIMALRVECENAQGTSVGTGFVIRNPMGSALSSRSLLFVTAFHVIDGCSEVVVTQRCFGGVGRHRQVFRFPGGTGYHHFKSLDLALFPLDRVSGGVSVGVVAERDAPPPSGTRLTVIAFDESATCTQFSDVSLTEENTAIEINKILRNVGQGNHQLPIPGRPSIAVYNNRTYKGYSGAPVVQNSAPDVVYAVHNYALTGMASAYGYVLSVETLRRATDAEARELVTLPYVKETPSRWALQQAGETLDNYYSLADQWRLPGHQPWVSFGFDVSLREEQSNRLASRAFYGGGQHRFPTRFRADGVSGALLTWGAGGYRGSRTTSYTLPLARDANDLEGTRVLGVGGEFRASWFVYHRSLLFAVGAGGRVSLHAWNRGDGRGFGRGAAGGPFGSLMLGYSRKRATIYADIRAGVTWLPGLSFSYAGLDGSTRERLGYGREAVVGVAVGIIWRSRRQR